MRHKKQTFVIVSLIFIVAFSQCRKNEPIPEPDNPAQVNDGKKIFREDTFGDETFWSGLLHLDKGIAGEANGGYGKGVSPATALALGLKVDAEALPAEVVAAIKAGKI